MQLYQEQFTTFYETYFARMVRFSLIYIEKREDAENLVQDVFVYLWEHPSVLVNVRDMDAFLFTLLKNRCINFLKHQTRLEYIEEETIHRLNLEALRSFEAWSDTLPEVEKAVNAAIARLPERCREILILNKFQHMKYKEISAKLGISVNTVENQMAIALKKLRTELKDYMPLLMFLHFFQYATFLSGI